MRNGTVPCILAAVSIIMLSVPVQAQDNRPEQKYSDEHAKCMAESGSADFKMAECDSQERDRWEKVRLDAYNQALTLLSATDHADEKAALEKAESAWVAFRDAECGYEYEKEAGGTLARVLYSGCMLSMTYDRAHEHLDRVDFLKKWYR